MSRAFTFERMYGPSVSSSCTSGCCTSLTETLSVNVLCSVLAALSFSAPITLTTLRRRDAQPLPVLQLFAGQPVVLHQDLFRDGILVGDVADIPHTTWSHGWCSCHSFSCQLPLRLFFCSGSSLTASAAASTTGIRRMEFFFSPSWPKSRFDLRLQDVVSLDPVGFRDGEQCLFFQH